jgi:hypothetical protein
LPLYLGEIYLNTANPDVLGVARRFARDIEAGKLPPGVRLVAGPWVSNQEAKLILVVDIADHTRTFGPFWTALASGAVSRRRLTPIAEANALDGVSGDR